MHKLVVSHPALTVADKQKIIDLAEKYNFSVYFFTDNHDALPYLNDAEIIYGMGDDLILAAPNLKWFASSSAGINTYLKVLKENTVLTSASGAYGISIAEHIIMVALAMFRRFREYEEIIDEHKWLNNLEMNTLFNSKIYVLGTGDIGSCFAQRVIGFKPLKIIGINKSGKNNNNLFDRVYTIDRLNELLPDADLLVMSLPDTKETHNIINAETLALMNKNAYIINVGRGSAIDEQALIESLKAHKLKGAALDVFQQEPISKDSLLWNCPNLLITPHCSGQLTARVTIEKNLALFLNNFEAYCNKKTMQNVIDRHKGY